MKEKPLATHPPTPVVCDFARAAASQQPAPCSPLWGSPQPVTWDGRERATPECSEIQASA